MQSFNFESLKGQGYENYGQKLLFVAAGSLFAKYNIEKRKYTKMFYSKKEKIFIPVIVILEAKREQ